MQRLTSTASFVLLWLFTCCSTAAAQTCPGNDYSLTTQAQVDAFPSGCTVVSGELVIEASADITDLSPLSGLTSIGAGLGIIENDALTNLNGLSALTSISGYLSIGSNTALANLDGLSGLPSVEGWITIQNNRALIDIDGLSALTFVRQYFQINGSAVLTNLDGLSALTSVGGPLWIDENAALENVDGLSGLTSVEALWIRDNAGLTNLDGLSALTSVGDYVWIHDNAVLSVCGCGLYACVSSGGVGGAIDMYNNAASGDCNSNGADLIACSVGIDDGRDVGIPREFSLHQNYPNPFNPTTTIIYDLPRLSKATLAIYDILGRQVRVLAEGMKPAGYYEVSLDATGLPSGVYIYRLAAGGLVKTKRMVVVK